jgi:hypothetical protein
MVPKVADKGTSFKGAGLYYLHDKKARTADRVAFTHTHNLATDDPDKAIRWMAYTAMHQAEIKQRAGGQARGRKLREPVYTYSLSWAPDETPTREEMLAAGMETLERLGLADHEVLFVAHKDEPHPHLHVIVNRVHPETGIAAPLSKDRLVLSEWAEDFERRQGLIRCENRVENNRRRRDRFVKERSERDYVLWRRARVETGLLTREDEKAALSERQKTDMAALRARRKAELEERRRELTDKQKPVWAELLDRQRHERAAFAEEQRIIARRLKAYLKSKEDKWTAAAQQKNWVSLGFDSVANAPALKAAMADRHQAERQALALRVKTFNEERLKPLRQSRDDEIAALRKLFAEENRALADRHKAESEKQAREIASGGGRTTYDFETAATPPQDPSLSSTFAQAADEGAGLPDPLALEQAETGKRRRFSAFEDAKKAGRRPSDGEERDGYSAFREAKDEHDREDGRERRRRDTKRERPGEPD